MSTPPRFNDSVEPHHLRLNVDEYDDIYVVGDVHGSHVELEHLLEKLALGPDDLVLFVGDLVRKGPYSPHVIDLVRQHDQLLSVRGNNEQKVIRGDKEPDWLREGDRAFFESLPVVISFDDAMVVHGGVNPARPLTDHSIEELLNMRAPDGDGYDGPFWYEAYEGPQRVFFGHTVHDEPFVGEHAVALDTGCVYGGTLTAYDYRRDRLVTVESMVTHEDRRDSKFVEPGWQSVSPT
ncbi:metallophosphoesterase family protein [Halolamina litorea]|uniref:Metallophosphoesterase family protein n=1 Tax=Halolamina litorea TaxID=1515593 RepID=A0ABD6BPR2_9EURY|nr:metallophosphoesterase family protein [Halolamina litorea]